MTQVKASDRVLGHIPGMQKQDCSTAVRPRSAAKSIEPFRLDIRPIFARGESPCGCIDEAVAGLKPGQDFILVAPFEPIPLFTKLAAQGFNHESEAQPDGSWSIRFVRARAAASETRVSSCCS